MEIKEHTQDNEQKNPNNFKRLTAHKIIISNILNHKYIKEEGWNPNYIIINNKKISKVNIMGFVINIEDNNFVIDDSTGSIQIRSFEENNNISNFKMGDLVIIIGKPREFNQTRYITPDIIKKIDDPIWLKIRLKELNIYNEKIINNKQKKEEIVEKIPLSNEIDKKELNDYEIILKKIEEKDSGEGISIDELLIDCNIDNCEKLINNLLRDGEIFELKPGIVKLL